MIVGMVWLLMGIALMVPPMKKLTFLETASLCFGLMLCSWAWVEFSHA